MEKKSDAEEIVGSYSANGKEAEYVRFFKIEIYDGETKIDPKNTVKVDIRLLDAPETAETELNVVQIAEENAEILEVAEPAEGEEGIHFETDKLDICSVVYCVV